MIPELLQRCCTHVSGRLLDAAWALDRGAAEIALVVDGDRRLVGTLTDGDIRRALLAGATLKAPLAQHMQRQFTSVTPETGRTDVLDFMRARSISQIPVIDRAGTLVGLHLIRELIGAIERPNWAVVMVGGKGTRLGPLTDVVPKPMLRVAGRPILERILLHLAGYGIRRVFLAVNHRAEVIEAYFGDGERVGTSIEYLREREPLGTGGGLSLLPEIPFEPLIVMNGDLVTQVNIASMLDYHNRVGQKVTVGVRPYVHTVPFGCLTIEGARVLRQEEKPDIACTVNAGVYVLSPDLLSRIPRDVYFPLPALVDDCLARQELVCAYEIEDDWVDVGQAEQLKLAREGSL